jgi:methylthioribose-1-phosphate isomerase
MIETIQWTGEGVVMIDQTLLPNRQEFFTCRDYKDVAHAIRTMVIRGAPAIGVAAAMGVAIGIAQADPADLDAELAAISAELAGTRPTAVNLFWAIDRMKALFERLSADNASLARVQAALLTEALAMYDEDIAACKAMGAHGADLMPDEGTVLTHCNAGALATCGYGTALGVIRGAVERGKRIHVFADETRPFL